MKMMNYKLPTFMKICVSLLLLFITVTTSAQEPANNLGKSVSELKQSFPDLVRWGGDMRANQITNLPRQILCSQ